jgi:dipeptidyl aminopeptidase/acylaminoacyl peptidase
MYQEKITILNRDKHPIIGILTLPDKAGSWPLMIGCHGLYGTKEHFFEHWKTTWNIVQEEGYGTFLFDFTNNLGESYGTLEHMTVGQEVSDLEDVLSYFWTKQYVQKDRIVLFGHSLGGMIELITASSSPHIAAIIAIAPLFHFQAIRNAQVKDEGILAWKEKGYALFFSKAWNQEFKIQYQLYENGISYDMPKLVAHIQSPLLIIQGDNDSSVPINQSYDLIRHLNCPHELLMVENGDHSMRDTEQQRMIANKTLVFLNNHLKKL